MDFDEQEEEQVEDTTRVDVDRRQLGGRSSTYDSDPHHPPPPPPLPQPPTQPRVGNLPARGGSNVDGGKYKECLKNHAVSIGGHAVDGCGEFMAAGEEGTADALKCAACNCHRNFHRKESGTDVVGGFSLMGITGGDAGGNMGGHGFHPHFTTAYNYRTPASGYLHHRGPPPPLALPSTSGAGEGSREEGEDVSNPMMMMRLGSTSGSGSKKRFRTRFTQDQKEKMLAFAERVGWRIQRHDEVLVQQFCSDIGVRRHVLKVWMHNNKNTLGKKP